MNGSLWRRCFVAVALSAGLTILGGVPVASGAADAYQASLEYAVDPGAYNNSVHAANVTSLLYPRLVFDLNATSPFAGSAYVLGLQPDPNGTCQAPASVRSVDGGRTFGALRVSSLCLPGLTLAPVIAPNGTIYAASWGPRILASANGGLDWTLLAALGNASAPTSMALDPASGTLFIAWIDQPWPEAGNLSVRSSRDGGRNWTAARRPLASNVTAFSPQIAVDGTSVVVSVIAYNATGPLVASVASPDGGTTWGPVLPLTASAPCLSASAPSIAVSPDGVFAIAWYADPTYAGTDCWGGLGNTAEALVAISTDHGRTFGAVRVAGGPPAWPTMSFGNEVLFDRESRLYVAWHSLDAAWNGTVSVASSADYGADFDEGSFSTVLAVGGGNSTAQETLARGLNDTVLLAWEAFDPVGGPTGPLAGIWVREVAGEAHGRVELPSAAPPSVTVELRENLTGDLIASVPWTGQTFDVGGLAAGPYRVSVQVDGTVLSLGAIPVRIWGRTTFAVDVTTGGAAPPGGGPPWTWMLVGTAVAGGGVAAATLYHMRIAREDALQRKVRQLMFDYVRAHPGASFSEVRDGLGLQNGAASYHLRVLEKLGLVHSESRGRRRWYYPDGDVSLWRELPLSPLQASIVEAVRREPGIGVRELARRVDHRASSVGYSVKALHRDGVLRTDRVSRRVRCFPADDGPAS